MLLQLLLVQDFEIYKEKNKHFIEEPNFDAVVQHVLHSTEITWYNLRVCQELVEDVIENIVLHCEESDTDFDHGVFENNPQTFNQVKFNDRALFVNIRCRIAICVGIIVQTERGYVNSSRVQ